MDSCCSYFRGGYEKDKLTHFDRYLLFWHQQEDHLYLIFCHCLCIYVYVFVYIYVFVYFTWERDGRADRQTEVAHGGTVTYKQMRDPWPTRVLSDVCKVTRIVLYRLSAWPRYGGTKDCIWHPWDHLSPASYLWSTVLFSGASSSNRWLQPSPQRLLLPRSPQQADRHKQYAFSLKLATFSSLQLYIWLKQWVQIHNKQGCNSTHISHVPFGKPCSCQYIQWNKWIHLLLTQAELKLIKGSAPNTLCCLWVSWLWVVLVTVSYNWWIGNILVSQ